MTELMAGLMAWQVLAVVATVGLVEGTGVLGYVVPGLVTLLTAGTLASAGVVDLPILLLVALASAAVGDSVGYLLGRVLGPRIERSRAGRLVGEQRWVRGREFLLRRGSWAVVAGRWFGPVRALVPFLAGGSGMPYGTFLRANLLGIVAYATTAILVGYGATSFLAGFSSALVAAAPYAIATLVVAGLTLVAVRRLAAHRTPTI